jgi:hypothetical protein
LTDTRQSTGPPVSDTVDALILDLLEWLGPNPRPYAEVLEGWRTSYPRLPVWEDANDRGFVARHRTPGGGALVSVSAAGAEHLRPPGGAPHRPQATMKISIPDDYHDTLPTFDHFGKLSATRSRSETITSNPPTRDRCLETPRERSGQSGPTARLNRGVRDRARARWRPGR